MTSWLVYDCEIIRAIAGRGEERIPGVEYVEGGWSNHAGMGVSVIGAFDYVESRYRVFLADNFGEFADLVASRDVLIGWNNKRFDDPLILACLGIIPKLSYDLKAETGSWSLNTAARANGFGGKSGDGALAPVNWQAGKIGTVIDYCLFDVKLTVSLLDLSLSGGLVDANGLPLIPRSPHAI